MNDETSVLRRLPVYILMDCSGSMAGEPIVAMEAGIRSLLVELQEDPQALETVWVSVITLGSTADCDPLRAKRESGIHKSALYLKVDSHLYRHEGR